MPPTATRLQRRIRPDSHRDCLLGVELPTKNRMLIWRVSTTALERQPKVSDSRGLSTRILSSADNPIAEVVLVLTEPELADLFDLLIRDLLEAAELPDDESAAVTGFLIRLRAWQDLFARLSPGGLSKQGQQGLWGEIWVLQNVVAPAVGMVDGVLAWQGPMGADQDFQIGKVSVEAKTNLGASDRMLISSERQLDCPPDIDLILASLQLETRGGQGKSLPAMVGESRQAATDSGCRQEFDKRLAMFGYADQDSERYAKTCYAVRSFSCFHVDAGFPRICPGDLDPGVTNVRYSVSAAACANFQIDILDPCELLSQFPIE